MWRIVLFLVLYSLLTSGTALARDNYTEGQSAVGDHIEVALLSQSNGLSASKINWLGVLLKPEPQWHVYWQNPGDSGEKPQVEWTANEGLEFGEFQWPIPKAIEVAHLVNYGYEDQVLLMVPVELTPALEAREQVTIKAALSWLVCKEDCIPGWADLTITLPISESTKPSLFAPLFEQTQTRLPKDRMLSGKHEITQSHLTVAYEPPYDSNWQLFPIRTDIIQHNQSANLVANTGQNQVLAKSDYFSITDENIEFLLTDGKQGYYLTTQLNNITADQSNLFVLLLMALVGGLILNIMPCVLPVLSIKAMAVQHQSMSFAQKWGYALGVLACFNLFAVLILLLKSSGQVLGWGFHMQEPAVIAFLAFLFVFIALILMDIAPAGARLAGLGQSLVDSQGFSSQFFTGVLAVVVASPCTAPFMAAALGVALVSEPLTTILIFNALAIGFALPLTLLFVLPHFASVIPKPGPWMNTFKHFLVFPMLATVIWLVWVYLGQTGSIGQFVLLISLLGFALLLWCSSQLKTGLSNISLLAALSLLVWNLSQSGNYQVPSGLKDNNAVQAYSNSQLETLKNEQQVVLVNMTADWCITCKVNEQVAFASGELQRVLAQEGVHYMVGDWTNKNQQILTFLQQYKRSGVPLYVVYAGNKYERVLPQILTADIVIDAINQAKEELKNET